MRVALLASGRGSNARALMDAAAEPDSPFRIVGLLSDHEGAGALDLARERDLPAVAVPRVRGEAKAAHEARVAKAMRGWAPDVLALAGYMRVMSGEFIATWGGRIVNIHPSLLPRHPGLGTHARALVAGDERHGCTVHWVTEGVDEGPVIAQASLAVGQDDDAETLGERVLALEHRLYRTALCDIARTFRDTRT